ncbi:MAG: hypothetical protein K2Y27_16945 [Xanthobacteraceae bacterium]|nr:hypothetical protein [Xanthobacteraceae bacterium]
MQAAMTSARPNFELLRKAPRLTVAGAHGAWPFPPAFMERLAKGLELAELPRT